MDFGLRIRGEIALVAGAALAAMALAYLSLKRSVEPVWVLTAIIAIVLSLYLMRKWPLLIFAGYQFVGNFKTVPARGFDLSDPTVILLLLCLGAFVIQGLFAFSHLDPWNLTARFKGQAAISILFLLLLACIAISVFYTPTVRHGSEKALRFAVFESLSFFYPILFLQNRKDVRQLVLSFVVFSIALSAKVLLGLLYAPDSVLRGDKDITQIGDGMLLVIGLIMALGNLERSKTMKYVAVPILSFGLIASAARSPLVALLITVPIVLLCAKNEIGRMTWKKVWVGGLLIVVVAVPSLMWLQTLPFAEQKLHLKEAELQSAVSGYIFSSGTFAQRLSFYSSALDAIAEHPVVGLGAGGWSIFYDNEDSPRFPHNFVLEVGAEQGLIGLSVLLALLALLFRGALRVLRSNPYLAFVFPAFVFCVVLNLITGDVSSRPLWFCCGLAAAASKFRLPSREHDRIVPAQHQFAAASIHA